MTSRYLASCLQADINIGDTAYSIPFQASLESATAQSAQFCQKHAAMLGLNPADPSSLVSCEEPVGQVLRQALEGHWRETSQGGGGGS